MNRSLHRPSVQRPSRRYPGWFALGVLLIASACGGSPPPPPEPAAPPVKTGAERVAWYQDCWRRFNEKDWNALQNCYTEQAVSEHPGGMPPVLSGRAAIIDFDKQQAEAFPDRRGDVLLVLGNGSHLASVAVFTGTNDGPMPGPDGKPLAATHKKFGFYLAHTVETDAAGATATSEGLYADDTTMMVQLGLVKAPARPVMTATGAAPMVVVARNDDTERANVAAYRAIDDAWNRGDMKAFTALMADDYKGIDITAPADQNKKETLATLAGYRKAFPDVKLNISQVWGAGDYVAATGTLTGTNTGPAPMMGVKKPTGKAVSVKFLEIAKYVNGKMSEDWTFFNSADFAAQLGIK